MSVDTTQSGELGQSGEPGASPATDPSTRIPAGRVRGTGSAREGAEHWWHERLSSVAVFLLFVWLIVSLLRLPALDYRGVTEWLRDPRAAVPMLLLVAATFWHLKMGLQVVIEDYVHDEGNKFLGLALLTFATFGGAAFAIFAVLKIAFAATGLRA
ncbi:MAG: succinate dehydrogenase / fumarate reductase, rane anchor subunit [Sphingomonadales bacterium]|jgi:succinate dehydrogenase / fumarate reductase membrane anchor subunit|nr:succinate dehydrogenase / fumarate reductase, rane anchor subunit [Sphingomonadales bacterium]